MCGVEGIFSLRIVTVDFYMEKPKPGLDPCFSELRAKEIKKVPIIRIFGSNTEGQKTCMHVHGIFPYLYIPYDKKDFDTIDKAVYLIASSIDKAINISLGQGSSGSQHVFKIQLVKGIPFYGYHQREHQYLKIYMLNPRFVKRIANLLQNGAIMGKIFQPHESHVPYILQFFIDYNLYGMSFLHVPNEVLKFRRKNEDDVVPYSTKKEQILDCNVAEKQSTSALELDIGSGFILNRFQLITKTGTNSNPGVESIWQDERVRREKLSNERDDVPPLDIHVSQERPNVKTTDSDDFYRSGLVNKLLQLKTPMDQTMNDTLQSSITPAEISNREKKRTFNLRKLIANAVYPEECSQDDRLTNASFIADHLSSQSMFHTSIRLSETPSVPESDDVFLDDTIVDEELVLSLTQSNDINQRLRDEDMQLLEVMRQLEYGEDQNDIDLDSTLAPLSQNFDINSSPKVFETDVAGAEGCAIDLRDNDSDNECLNDFSIAMDDMDELLLKLTQTSQPRDNIPVVAQYDGADDVLRTPSKSTLRRQPTTPTTPNRAAKTRSPRTPRTPNSVAKKYAPLPLIIQSRSLKKNLLNATKQAETSSNVDVDDDEAISVSSEESFEMNAQHERKRFCMRKKLALSELRRKSISTNAELEADYTRLSNCAHKRRKTIDLDRTHITCNFRPARRKHENRLKVYNAMGVPESDPNLRFSTASALTQQQLSATNTIASNKLSPPKVKVSPRVLIRKYPIEIVSKQMTSETNAIEKSSCLTNEYNNSKLRSVSGSASVRHSDCQRETKISPRVLIKKHSLELETLKSPVAARGVRQLKYEFSPRHKATDSKLCVISPRVLIKKHPMELESSTPRKDSSRIQHSPQYKSPSPTACKSSRKRALQHLKSKSNEIRACYHSEISALPETRSTEPEPAQSLKDTNKGINSSVGSNKSIGNVTKISPRVILKKCSRIKALKPREVLANGHSKHFPPTETTNLKRKSRLSLSSHRKFKERNPKHNIKRFEEEVSSSDLEDVCPLASLKSLLGKAIKLTPDAKPARECQKSSPKLEASQTHLKEKPNVNKCGEEPSSAENSLNSSPNLAKKLKVRLKREKINVIEKQVPKTPTTPKPYSVIVNNEYELIPVAGPSHLDRFWVGHITTPRSPEQAKRKSESGTDDDPTVYSFYEKSFFVDSPVFSELSVPSPSQLVKCNQSLNSAVADKVVIITPNFQPETYQEVERNCKLYDIPDMVHQIPFYSNYADVTHRKEVGHTILCIPGKSLNDIEDFHSTISGLEGLIVHRKKMMQSLGVSLRNDDQIREYLSTEKPVLVAPSKLPPSKHDAKVWLKSRELLKEKGEQNTIFEDDSPIKIRCQKVVMLMENESGESADDMDSSMRSLTLTPLTPVVTLQNNKITDSYSCTPPTAGRSESISNSVRGPRPLRAKVSLSQKLKDICLSNAFDKCTGEEVLPTVNCGLTAKALRTEADNVDDTMASRESLQSNETITNEEVLTELEKSSFVRNLHSSQGSFDASFGLSIATLNNTYGFKVNLENLQQAKSDIEHNYLTTLSLELFTSTREDLLPNPQFDAIMCIFYAIENSIPSTCTDGVSKASGFIIVGDSDSATSAKYNGIHSDVEICTAANELEGLVKLLDLCARWDPDIFVGYEIEMSSWGYVMERAKYLDFNIAPLLSRVPSQKVRDFVDEDRKELTDLDVETKLCGRIMLDVWRLMRSEIALTSYTFENVMYHILHRRCPRHTHRNLNSWFRVPQTRWIVLEYYLERVRGTLELLDQLDLIGRTSEMAKLIGIQFYEVLSRGSQFRVESMMLRIAKPRNLVPLSPSVQQRAHMRAPEYLPLILEPQSRFYPDPMIVLDFQSLYPSMIMAYNYCFSTCLGRVEHLGQSVPFEFGASQLRVSPKLLRKLLDSDLVTVSPCGAVFVKREVREGILPRMLTEVLDTRQMVKQSMKLHKSSTALQRILQSRQLGLKLIANVTYGYTAANFSGRMPCVEVGDSVLSKGRETLERAIKLVETNGQWNVKVVYGDTDSLFVLVPGRSRAEAFKIGSEIAELVTQDNPQPVKLKLEKVYQPCILQTKKRYVGYMYEAPDQEKPVFEAKGIETVRRDGCPAAAKMLEKCLRILFESADVSRIKSYVCRQFTKLLSGKANIQDLIFAKEFRGLNGYKPTACVPALELTRKWMQIDPRRIPRRGERVPFIVTNGPPGLPLIKLVRSPHDVLADEGLKINAIYYITKAIIPPLNRCLLLIGADANEWFTNLPRKILFTPALSTANEIISTNATKKSTISQYFSSTNCIIDCGRQTKQGICTFCSVDATKSVVTLEEKISKLQRGFHLTKMVCQACCGRPNFIDCASLDCPVLYVLAVKRRELSQITHIQSIIDERY